MTPIPARLQMTLAARVARLRHRREALARQIAEERRRPLPCSAALQSLKRQRLRMKDQIALYTARLAGAPALPQPGR
jgi:hypothetical protein